MNVYVVKDSEGRYVARPRSLASAHRWSRRANMAGSSVARQPKLRYLGDVIGSSRHFGQCPRCGGQHMSTHERVSEEGAGRFGHGYLCERCAYSVAGDANRVGSSMDLVSVFDAAKQRLDNGGDWRGEHDGFALWMGAPSGSRTGQYDASIAKGGRAIEFRSRSFSALKKMFVKYMKEFDARFDANRAGASMEVAETILAQLGGAGRLRAMIGAKDFSGGANVLTFRWAARAKNGANSIRIKLEPSDTYKVEFYSVRGASVKLKGSVDDIYADGLIDLFERQTGLYLRM